ncbi:MAG: hypothetical protein JWN46_71 [Acidimicrobiales bacterium]|nr:hypothetical protein [Acidimicrobiales bacterium]
MTDDQSPEHAVRQYLTFLEDPTKLVDPNEVAALEAKVAEADDPIEKLLALSALERARVADGERAKLAFILHARAFADQHDVSASAFRRLGVPDDVLEAARLVTGDPRQRGRLAAPPRTERRPQVPVTHIKDAALAIDGPFTLVEVSERAGGSPGSVRKAVDELVADGRVERLGPDPDHNGRGRAPLRYQVRPRG